MDARCAPVVAGPPRPITTEQFNGPVAQSVERRSYKADVVRAIRTGTTNNAVLAGYVGRTGRNPVVPVTRKVRFLGAAPLDRSMAGALGFSIRSYRVRHQLWPCGGTADTLRLERSVFGRAGATPARATSLCGSKPSHARSNRVGVSKFQGIA